MKKYHVYIAKYIFIGEVNKSISYLRKFINLESPIHKSKKGHNSLISKPPTLLSRISVYTYIL